jgi:DNA-binding response OmpR family regulator
VLFRSDRALLNGIEIGLTGKEFELLWVLASEAGKCVPYDSLLDRVWPGTCVEQQQILHRKSRLMKKIEDRCGSSPSPLIGVVRGRGLYLDV